jgi:hypothetical protein
LWEQKQFYRRRILSTNNIKNCKKIKSPAPKQNPQ